MKIKKRDWLLLLLTLYFTFIGGTFYSQFNIGLRVANQLIVTALLGGWLFMRLRRSEGLPRTSLDLALGLYVAVNFISAVAGQSPRYSLEILWQTVAHLLAFYLLVDLIRRGWTAKLLWAIYMTSAAVCLVGLAEFMAWYIGIPQVGGFFQGWPDIGGWANPIPPIIYRLNITLNGSTPLAAYLALLIPPAIGLILTLRPYNQNRKALLIWLMLALLVEVLSFSRAGILALGVSLGLLLVSWLIITGRRWADVRRQWQRLRRPMRMALLLAAVVMMLLGSLWLWRSFSGRTGSTNFRFTLWQVATVTFQDDWLTGVGPGNFGRALLRLNDADLPRRQITAAHSIYFNTAAELGLLGLLTGALFYFLAARSWWRHWQQLTTPSDKIRLAAVGAALVGLAFQLLVDTYSATPNILPIMGLLAFIAAPLFDVSKTRFGNEGDRNPAAVQSRFWAAAAGLTLLLAYLAGLLWIATADFRFQNSLRYEQAGNLPEAIAQAELAYQRDPALPLYLFRQAYLESHLAAREDDPLLLVAPIQHYQAGLSQEPVYGVNSANLAALLGRQGRWDQAAAVMERTLAASDEVIYRFNLGYFYEQQGDWPQAIAAYGQVLSRVPALAGSEFWQAVPERAAHWPEIVRRSLAEKDSAAAEMAQRLALALARPELATELSPTDLSVLAAQPSGRNLVIDWHLSQGDLTAAEALLPAQPAQTADYLAWGRLHLARGNFATAEQFLKTAVFLRNHQAYFYLGQLYEQQENITAAEAAYNHSFFLSSSENVAVALYGRFGGIEMAPQLLRIAPRPTIESALALARLYHAENRPADATRVYNLLRQVDYFLTLPPGQ